MTEDLSPILSCDLFAMSDRFWIDYSWSEDGIINADVGAPLLQNGFEFTEQNLNEVTEHMLSEMRKEYPKAILVCHL